MEKTTLLILLPAVVAVVAVLGLVRGVVTKKPPGQRGLAGTGLENSRGLSLVQMASLLVLLVACTGWIVWVLVVR